jgi:hypothetical protein
MSNARPAELLLQFLSTADPTIGDASMAPADVELLRDCLVHARRLVVLTDPFLSSNADSHVAALHEKHSELSPEDIRYFVGLAVGLELAAAFGGGGR